MKRSILPAAVAVWAMCVAAAPADADLSCRVESAVNTSLGERLPLGEPIRHRVGDLQIDEDAFRRTERHVGTDFEAEVQHEIDRQTGSFVAIRQEVRHDVGEQWEIRLTGTCVPVETATP